MTTVPLTTPESSSLAARLRRLLLRLPGLRPYLRRFFVDALLQKRVLSKTYPGVMHALIFWGVTIQVLGTGINLMQMQLFIPFVELPFPRGSAYLAYELIMDLAGAAILIGIGMAMLRRWILRPKTLESRWDDHFALILLLLIPLMGFTTEAMRLLSTQPEWAAWSPVGQAYAGLFSLFGLPASSAAAVHGFFFWTHAVLGLTLVGTLPFTKLRHLFYTPLNAVLRSFRRSGVLDKIENIDEVELLGVGKVEEFAPRDLLSFDACVRCGRCEEACPAYQSGMDYSPRTFIQALRTAAQIELTGANGNGHQRGASLSEYVHEETTWACTTCGACLSLCPAYVNPVDRVIDMRRYQVLTTGKMPKPVGETLRNLERQGNPWGMPPEERITWAEGLDVRELAPGEETDVLLYLGCALAYDERSRQAARSLVTLLNKAGVDFAVLGLDETCCGETARRLGHEYLFQMFAEQTLEVLGSVKFNRILTQCAHCFNTLKNEYPQFGSTYTVQHYTEFLPSLDLPWSTLQPSQNGLSGKITFHDSCYLGRYNDIYQAPRGLLDKAGIQQVEMEKNEADGFCCGGGGGQMWLETDPTTRINHRRLSQALDTKAEIVTTACPYCLLMFDDAIRSKGAEEQIKVMDLAEVLAKRFTEPV
jgi:Fe-S oxidoreductase/nitrate reductase gamma subunit